MPSTVRGALLLLALLLGTAASARAAQAAPDSTIYRMDPVSRLVVRTGKTGLFSFAGHTHVVRARALEGTLKYRRGAPMSSLRLTVPTDSLEVLTPPDSAEIRKVTEAMRSDVLHVAKYPEMTFAADSVEAHPGKVRLQLDVTMHGTTRTVPVVADVTIADDTIRATGTFRAKQTDFGIKPYRGGPGGVVKVADEVTFCFDLVAVRGAGKAPAERRQLDDDFVGLPGCVDRFRPAPERPM